MCAVKLQQSGADDFFLELEDLNGNDNLFGAISYILRSNFHFKTVPAQLISWMDKDT